MNAQLVKNKLSEYYYKSLFVDSVVDIHPVSLVNSVKSIIGIDLNISHDLLLNYCINYRNSCQSVDSIGVFEEMEVPAAISFATLEESLINRDFDTSIKNVYSLLKVSDGKHILEFLLEFTLKYNNSVYSLVWSVYKMSLFLNHKNINDSIIFCVKYISDNRIGTKISEDNELKIDFSKYRYSSKSIKKILIYYSILDEDLVRIANISKYIKINTFREFNFSNYNKELIVYDDQIKHGRKWISLYIKNLKEDQLDVKLIITLDMFRGALKVSNGQYDKEVWNNLNNYLDK
jgi:hypothetical protein